MEMIHMTTLTAYLAGDRSIAVLTGAGISVPSGIPPFRGAGGLYNNKDVERCLSVNYLRRQPREFWAFYRSLFAIDLLLGAEPNAVHRWLSSLEAGHQMTVITQNIDGLHRKASSTHVIEMHGSFDRTVCPACGKVYHTATIRHQSFPHCSAKRNGTICGSVLKPDIVLFGEPVRGFAEAERAVTAADRFIILGSSLAVAPANFLPVLAKAQGVPTLLINDRPALQMDGIDCFVRADFSRFDPEQLQV
jgi:NAD-dependent deacetylase